MVKLSTLKTKHAIKRFEEITGLKVIAVRGNKRIELKGYYLLRFVMLLSQVHKKAVKRSRISKARKKELLANYQQHLTGGIPRKTGETLR